MEEHEGIDLFLLWANFGENTGYTICSSKFDQPL